MRRTPHAAAILAATILGSAMVFIDGTAVNVALPVFQRDLHADVAEVQWIVESYQLFLSALVLVGGSLSDHFGRRRVFVIGVAAFAICSAWCGLAPSVAQMIAARAVQGIAGALLVPSSLAILGASFDEDRGKAIGTWSAFTSLTAAGGPVIGGWLVEHLSWRWVFFLNVPLAIIVLALTVLRVPESRDETAGALDLSGALLITASLSAIVFALVESSRRPFADPLVWGAAVTGCILLVGFFWRERRAHSPLLPLELFRSRLFSACNLLTFLLYGALGGVFFFLPFELIQVLHYSPLQAGAANLPMILMIVLLSRFFGGIADRNGARIPLIVGPAIAGFGFAMLAWAARDGSYWTTFFPAALVLGFGMSITVAPLTTAVMSAAGEKSGIASGVNNAVSRTASLMAVAVLGVIVVGAFTRQLDHRIPTDLDPKVRAAIISQSSRLADLSVPTSLSAEQRARVQSTIAQSYVWSYRLAMLLCAALAAASALVSALWISDETKLKIEN